MASKFERLDARTLIGWQWNGNLLLAPTVGNNERGEWGGVRDGDLGEKLRIEDEARSRNGNGGVQRRAVYICMREKKGKLGEHCTLVCKEVESLPSYCTSTVCTVIQ